MDYIVSLKNHRSYTISFFRIMLMAQNHQERRPSYNEQLSRVSATAPRDKVPNLSNLPRSFKRGKFKCIRKENNQTNVVETKYSEIQNLVSPTAKCNFCQQTF